ncbi:hypothetical protein NE237_023078 [Protea cynaroides]|uniref:Uncharacterized protein n=1 Tax=Protea cynaroides TaxID=273540 RepID=A0A9Q0K443_9MAGN|nr:hypothetical protein NE237_023078 [Protea cynaroides]
MKDTREGTISRYQNKKDPKPKSAHYSGATLRLVTVWKPSNKEGEVIAMEDDETAKALPLHLLMFRNRRNDFTPLSLNARVQYVDSQNIKEGYGLWYGISIVLAEISGTFMVELGAGTSLPGLVTAKVGSDVTLTDNPNRFRGFDYGLLWTVFNKVVSTGAEEDSKRKRALAVTMVNGLAEIGCHHVLNIWKLRWK